jgi:hypothetical protein
LPTESGVGEVIVITTKTAAAARQQALPQVFTGVD